VDKTKICCGLWDNIIFSNDPAKNNLKEGDTGIWKALNK
jgi:hypothetical protein